MLRSLYSGVSGMRGFQQKLDVIGNNISNVNSFGFKKGRVTFKDMMSQTTQGAQAPLGDRGGINPLQVGLGVSLGSIDTIHTQGSLQTTNRPLDLAIQGDGFFVLQDLAGETFYTRSGNFYLDAAGDIVNADGYYLSGVDGVLPLNIPETATSFSISPNGTVSFVTPNGLEEAGQIGLSKFSNPGALQKTGGNLYQYTENSNLDIPLVLAPSTEGLGSLQSGALEMSNVDLSEEFTEMIVTQRGFQANTKIITTSDEILQELVNLKR